MRLISNEKEEIRVGCDEALNLDVIHVELEPTMLRMLEVRKVLVRVRIIGARKKQQQQECQGKIHLSALS